jgi:predicted transcriptional regulator
LEEDPKNRYPYHHCYHQLQRGPHQMDPYSSVEKVMSAPLITVSKDTDIGVATKIMIERKIRRLPVVEGGSLVGIITARDVLNITPKALEVRNFEDILKDI